MKKLILVLFVVLNRTVSCGAEQPLLSTYRSTGGHELELRVHLPGDRFAAPRPALLLFHGGSWTRGTPSQLDWLALGLSRRGWVVAAAQYRLLGKDAKSVADCASDARAALATVHASAARWNIDAKRIAVGGASAGGQLALVAAMQDDFPPSAVIGLNAVVSVANPRFNRLFDGLGSQLDPLTIVGARLPPALLLHGSDDKIVPLGEAVAFTDTANARGAKVVLRSFAGKGHGFFNPTVAGADLRAELIELIARFLQ